MTTRWTGLVILCCVLMVGTAAAITVTANDVTEYSVAAESGMVIYKIIINDLPFGTNQTHTLFYNGQPMLLTIGTYTEYAIWKNADISLTLPNGSVQTAHTSATTIVGNYKTTVQPVVRMDSSQLNSGTIAFLTVDLMIGVNPVGVRFSTQPSNFNPSGAIPFTSASGELGAPTDVYVYEVTEADFHGTIENYNPAAGLGDLGSAIFQWTWTSILGFVNMIPVVGPIMVGLIEVMGNILGTGYFWLYFIVANFPAVLCGVECLILMMAVINAGTGKNTFKKLASNVYQYNVAFIRGLIGITEIVWGWTRTFVQVITDIVQALKPI